jgi:hypothetical protein
MSLLGKFQKQPAEVEKYAIQYVQALSPSDELMGAKQTLAVNKEVSDVVRTAGGFYPPPEADRLLIVAKGDVYLHVDAPVGSLMYVANDNDTDNIDVEVYRYGVSTSTVTTGGGDLQLYIMDMDGSYTFVTNPTDPMQTYYTYDLLPDGTYVYNLYTGALEAPESMTTVTNVDVNTFVVLQTVYNLFARESAVFVKAPTGWQLEAAVQANVINSAGDQRVRYTVTGGAVGRSYKIETTVSTQEGRVLQDEFQVKIKEI